MIKSELGCPSFEYGVSIGCGICFRILKLKKCPNDLKLKARVKKRNGFETKQVKLRSWLLC